MAYDPFSYSEVRKACLEHAEENVERKLPFLVRKTLASGWFGDYGKRLSLRVMASAMKHLAAHEDLGWVTSEQKRAALEREIKRKVKRDVRPGRFGFVESLIIAVIAGLLVRFIMDKIKEMFGRFGGGSDVQETLETWARESHR